LIIAHRDLHFVIPFSEFRDMQTIIDLLNSHFLFRQALYFSAGQEDGVIKVSRYDCIDFAFEFTASFTSAGEVMNTTSQHWQYTPDGTFGIDEAGNSYSISETRNCEATSYIPHQAYACSYPCNGLAETSVYTWPDSDEDVRKMLERDKYTFLVGNYASNGIALNSKPVTISITPDQYNKDGLAALAMEFNKRFPQAIQFGIYDELTLPHDAEQRGFDFTIKRAVCEPFSIEITGQSGGVYTYTERGLVVKSNFSTYPQKLNTVVADECRKSRKALCDGKLTTNTSYTWFDTHQELRQLAEKGEPYTFWVNRYSLNGTLIVEEAQQHILPPDQYRNGWPDIAAYMNNRFALANGITFETETADPFPLTFNNCTQFNLVLQRGDVTLTFNEYQGYRS
jgi:hypothetical protein